METRPHIGIIVPGGIGREQNIPSLVGLLYGLSETMRLTIYSFTPTDLHPLLVERSCLVNTPPAGLRWSTLLTAKYFMWKIWNEHRKDRFELIHGFWVLPQGALGVAAGLFLGIPSIITIPGGDIVYIPRIKYGGLRTFFHKIAAQWSIANAGRIVVLSTFQKEIMTHAKLTNDRIHVVPFGVDTGIFQFKPKKFSAPYKILFIGNLNKVKDPYTAINAFLLVSRQFDCTLTIVGFDALGGDVQRYARSIGLEGKIDWKGERPHSAIVEELHSSDILVISSLYEGEGVVVMEAFAAGTAVVGTRVGLLYDLGDDRMTADAGSDEGLREKMEWMISHPDERESILRRNRAYAEGYDIHWTCEEYQRIYKNVMH